ncbi:unnamed protein product [Owenia fusiformis]|uniref:Uncharacterized protein n=1 Tax=Owenia fusiformis TaxID=6347 RepID=A0A8J1Y7G3_OWEFU|nr:unnamed protein product [Owenia fusiformis]
MDLDVMFSDFHHHLKEVIQQEPTHSDAILSKEDVNCLLSEDSVQSVSVEYKGITGYPTHPLYKRIGDVFLSWIKTGHCPLLDLRDYDLLDEKLYKENRAGTICTINPQLEGFISLWDFWVDGEKQYKIREIFKLLGKRGLLEMLGLRKTVGTVDSWPPPRSLLEQTFQDKHKENVGLTVGARALAKHGHRDMSATWWGLSTGNEAAKNQHAYRKMTEILDNATWINIHQLPHDIHIIECRMCEGYGVRWTKDGSSFRGFLEPQMEDGHDVGWRH